MRQYIRNYLFAVLSLLLLVSLSCASLTAERTKFPGEFTDQLGRVVQLDKVPRRIISIAPSNTEILFALGLADKVVGVTDYDDYPPAVKDKPSVGSYSTPSIERTVSLGPDLILATSIHATKVIPQLEAKGIPVLVLDPKNIEEVLAAITLVGKVTGQAGEASKVVAAMQKRIKAVTDLTSPLTPEQRPRVFYIVWHDPLTAPGSGTFQDDLIQKAGGTNIAKDLSGWAKISLETVIEANPEVMIAAAMGTGTDEKFQFILDDPRLGNTDARQQAQVYSIDGGPVSRAGPRLVDALEQFAKIVHPELFSESE